MKVIRIGGVSVFRSILETFKKEWNSWSLRSWILVRFRIIILELVIMLMLAIWGTEKRPYRLPWVS
jgi:hypothetical protein